MKKIVLLLLFILSVPTLAQNEERWDKTGVYSNFEWGFSWVLPKEITWEKSSGIERHTVFRAYNPDTQLTVFVNINPPGGSVKLNENALWDNFEAIEKQLSKVENSLPSSEGGRIIESHSKKVMFAGKKAIKRTYTTRYDNDERYKNESFDVYAVTYSFIYKNASWSVSFKLYKEFLEYAGEGVIDEVFRGFSFIVSDSDSRALQSIRAK